MSDELDVDTSSAGGIGPLIGGGLVTLISVGLLLGGFLLNSLDAWSTEPALPTTAVFLPTPTPSATPVPWTPSPLATEAPIATEMATPTPTPTLSPTATPMPVEALIPTCTPPAGWVLYTVRRGDTLTSLAMRSGVTAVTLMQANCLVTSAIYVGQRLYLPPFYYSSPTPQPFTCGPPLGWTIYYVKAGDTLYALSRRFGVGIEAIRRANCLTTYTIYVGQPLYLPPLLVTPTYTPTPTGTMTPSPTPTLTLTPTEGVTPTPSFTPTPEATLTPTTTPSPEPPTPTEMSPSPSDTPAPTPGG